MSWPTHSALSRMLVPLLVGAALGTALQLTESQIRLYIAMSPGLLAGIAGLAGTVILAVVTGVRRRMAAVAASASAAALRDAAAEATRDRLRFLARLDHELKNPLTAIRAGLVHIEQAVETQAPDATRTALGSVSAQTDRITLLVSDLRKLAELETQEIEMAPVNLPSLLHEVAESIGEIPDGRKRSIRVNVPQAPWPPPLIDGDRDLLFVAVQNLAANSVKFSAPGDTVEIRASEDGDAVLAEVADTGAGIPADEIGQVWQELARGRAARSVPGTGIGLALVRVIATRHGGRVAIRSREGQGTVVSLWLPLPGRASTAPGVAILRQHRDTPGRPLPDEDLKVLATRPWTTEYTRSDMRASFFPFGQGIRNCIGEGFAWAETVLVLSAIAARWNLRLADGASVRPVVSSTLVANELPVVVTRRDR